MALDIGNIVNQIVEKLKADPDLMEKFTKDPGEALEKLTGIDLPNDQLDAVIAAVKAKLGDGKGAAAAALNALGGLFKK